MTDPRHITGQFLKLAEPPTLDHVVITYGGKRITIPTPPIQRSAEDAMGVIAAALIGLAIKAGIEPEDV